MEELIDAIAKNLGMVGLFGFFALLAILATVRELARIRLDIARQRSSDLLKRRFTAYGRLWMRMQSLAVYTPDSFNAAAAGSTSINLTEWYFSASGGLFLTEKARDFYFALQETLRSFSTATALQSAAHVDGRATFCQLLQHEAVATTYRGCINDYINEQPEKMPRQDWLHLCRKLRAIILDELVKDPSWGSTLAFCMVQQVSSTLRTQLAHELQTRLDSTPKWWRVW
jgi:hypothetical protein